MGSACPRMTCSCLGAGWTSQTTMAPSREAEARCAPPCEKLTNHTSSLCPCRILREALGRTAWPNAKSSSKPREAASGDDGRAAHLRVEGGHHQKERRHFGRCAERRAGDMGEIWGGVKVDGRCDGWCVLGALPHDCLLKQRLRIDVESRVRRLAVLSQHVRCLLRLLCCIVLPRSQLCIALMLHLRVISGRTS